MSIEKQPKRKSGKGAPTQSKKSRQALVNPTIPPIYTIRNGLRHVEPYNHTFVTYCKQRWENLPILQVFSKEFNDKNPEYYEYAIKNGEIRVNGNQVPIDYKFKNSDFIETHSHRHEPPVTDTKIEIVQDSDDMLIISKPSGIPVHPTGRYRHNSMIHVLEYEYGYKGLHIINRLDRLTSGLVLIAKTKLKAAEMGQLMKLRTIKKTYYARVKGEFPRQDILVDKKIRTCTHKVGVNIISEEGKPCETRFTFLSFNGTTSLVKCEPLTGRTHQIRVHLQYLGFPVANDPLYCCSEWGDYTKILNGTEAEIQQIVNKVTQKVFPSDSKFDINFQGCYECRDERQDPLKEQLMIWLHAYEYKADDFYYKTGTPDWAQDGWQGDDDIQARFWDFGGLWDGVSPHELI